MGEIRGARGLLSHITTVAFYLMEKSNFANSRNFEFRYALKQIQRRLSLSPSEAGVFALLFFSYCDSLKRPVPFVASTSNFSLHLLQYQDDLDALVERGFLEEQDDYLKDSRERFFTIPRKLELAIARNEPIPQLTGSNDGKSGKLLLPDKIIHKELFFPQRVMEEIENLKSALMPSAFAATQRRLEEKALSTGIVVMLYGESGTGKTETVYQIAKSTGRALQHVDIASIKSPYVGGMEQNLSALFSSYEEERIKAEEEGREIPILLFNEADAIFAKRLATQNSRDVHANQIQSTLLDLLDKFKGILIATTNIFDSFDEAFERRFLYKIKYEKPDLLAKQRIWQNKLGLAPSEAERLARQYESFSGGQIANVAKKAMINEVISGKQVTPKDLDKYCDTEKKAQDASEIGFKV